MVVVTVMLVMLMLVVGMVVVIGMVLVLVLVVVVDHGGDVGGGDVDDSDRNGKECGRIKS